LIASKNKEETLFCGIFFYNDEKKIKELSDNIILEFSKIFSDKLNNELTEKLLKIKDGLEKDSEKIHLDVIESFKSFDLDLILNG
jgi:hypothetical protein